MQCNVSYLFDLFHTFEFNEQYDGIDLILMEALYGAQVDIQDTMLPLQYHGGK